MFINESPIQCQIEYCAGSEQRTNSVGGMVHYIKTNRRIAEDLDHSTDELRYYCFGRVLDGIMTVRFTHRGQKIRIIGAGYWRKGRKIYENTNS